MQLIHQDNILTTNYQTLHLHCIQHALIFQLIILIKFPQLSINIIPHE